MKICIIGPGKLFLSGITHYTLSLANNLLNKKFDISLILFRKLLPTAMYPGKAHVGRDITKINVKGSIKVFDGVDWYWLPSMFRALLFSKKKTPDIFIFQWWSSTVFHSYLLSSLYIKIILKRIPFLSVSRTISIF